MRNVTPELEAHLLNENTFTMADLFEFRLLHGATLRYCGFDRDLLFDGQTFSSQGPVIRRSNTRCVVGLEVDTLELDVAPSPNDLLLGMPWIKAAGSGALDGAGIALYRAFLRPDLSVIGGITLFVGQVGEITTSRNKIAITVNSHLQMLNTKMPRNLWQPSCLHTLYDADCGVARNGNTTTANAGSTAMQIHCGLSQEAGWFDQGYVTITSGALAGQKRTVKSYTPGTLHLLLPLPAAPVAGDALSAYPGCDKTQGTCTTKFNNVANFRGFPFIPIAETAI